MNSLLRTHQNVLKSQNMKRKSEKLKKPLLSFAINGADKKIKLDFIYYIIYFNQSVHFQRIKFLHGEHRISNKGPLRVIFF